MIHHGGNVFVSRGVLLDVFKDQRQLGEHHGSACVDARCAFAEPQGIGGLRFSGFGLCAFHPILPFQSP
jgi:hypothetical protein